MTVARPGPTSEIPDKRHPGEVSKDGKNWVSVEESAQDGDGWKHSCGTYLIGKTVFLSVRDGVFPLSGTGEVENVVVPFCPKCEHEPEGHGIVTPDGKMVVN